MSHFKAKMHRIAFRLQFRPIPHWGRLQRYPNPLTVFKWLTVKGRDGRQRIGRDGEGRGM